MPVPLCVYVSVCACVYERERGLLYAFLSVLKPLMRTRGGQTLRNAPLNCVEMLCMGIYKDGEPVDKEQMYVSPSSCLEVSFCL